MSCLKCITDCCESIIKFINYYAYIECALRGTNFCSSCSSAVRTLARNPIRLGLVHSIGALI